MNDTPRNATVRSPANRLFHFVGTLAYLGYVPFASGTVSVALVGIPVYWVLVGFFEIGTPAFIVVTAALTAIAVWIAGRTDLFLGEKDSKKNVIDEIPGYWIALIGLPATWQIITAAFFLERAIDIAKVWPANWIERKLPGGWGVVFDDVVAGLYALAILHGAVRFLPGWFG
ncbi:MAG TPA: phosphatidylglycerophosphatase A [Phycisphaerae bacterium]|nr:phosphatidylglycerophosphatase A [Phycisphaerae bacterium]